ncbi:MAG: hypothetical protein CBC47_01995 [Alphaproteobacteria bacterium TMED87]|nr:hypothetical protein [Rhodospirillaceae bacterium]OUV11028.1 MAG: hypothetical protein CBC47_01995 [Alphaproteobacteria bacterium TMED87]|tara:strand:- start:12 stop:320 length:309 start_codon:yes stop_codon:yes gene_type:complete
MKIDEIIEAAQARENDLKLLNHTVLFDLEEDGKILMDASGDDLKITLNPPNDEAETTLILSKENMEELITGELSPMVAFTMGKVKVLGSKGVALKLSGLLEN